jgi:hypothetical protein
MNQVITNTIKTITGTCGGVGSWLSNPLSNAGPDSGSIQSLPPYSSSSAPSSSLFGFPGILLQKGGGGKRCTRRRIRKKHRRIRRTRRTRKRKH